MPVVRSFFQKIPFIRITSLFLIGILISHYLTIEPRWIGFGLTILITILIFNWHNSNYSTVKIQNLLISACIVLIGVFYPNAPEKHQITFDSKAYYLADVCQKPAEKAKTFQTVLLIQNKTLAKPEKVISYFSKENFDTSITTGDQLILLGRPQEIRNSGNPFEIDYQSIMHQRDIWLSVYLTKGTYLKTGNHSSRLTYLAEEYRDKLIALLTIAIPEKEERSVVSALTLGYRAEIGQDTLDYFASTGAMHVLSVSGLHVALIYVILGFILSFIKRGKTGTFIFAVVMIAFLWIYAFITGFSPAVQRATVMFTFVIIGNSIRRPVNIYNSLTASALFLMLLNPDVIFDIGFQLSYLAIFGIVLIQPTLYNLFELTNPILKWTWSLFTVSVAAQLTTFPLSIFYFNQFPNLFWLSGFVVIPVTTFIIWLTLAFFIFSPIHGLALIIGKVIQLITHVMLVLLKAMDAFPGAVWEGIVVTQVQVYLLFGCIIAILIFAQSKKKGWLFATLSLVILFQVTDLQEKRHLLNQNIVFVYNTKDLMIHLINDRTNYLITDDYKLLSESEKSTLKRVCNHLKLNQTQVISQNQINSIKISDLVIRKDQIQFINSLIKFRSADSFRQNREQMEVAIYPIGSNAKPIISILDMGNASFGKKKDDDSFRIKQQGAFYANLKSE